MNIIGMLTAGGVFEVLILLAIYSKLLFHL